MVEQFNLVSTNELPKLIFNGRIRELKPDSKVRILNTTVNIAIDQIFRNQNLQKIRLFVISHDFEGEIYVEPIKYDALFFKLGINQLSIKISRQFDDIFIEQQKIIESFLTKRYLDVVILINELMDNEKVELLAKDVFRLYCLQAHSLIKSGLIDKAETSLSMAKQILKELDPTELNNNWRENYSINNPLSESIFLDRGYLSGDEIYLLFLEIINGIAQPNYDVDIIQQKIQEGILQTQNSNIDYHLEFNFLSLLINNNGIALSEINKFKSCIKNSNKFFTLLVDGLSGGDIDENSLDLPLTEDLTGMIEEFKSNGIITRRMYHTNQSHINLSVESDFHYMDPIISDSKGRTIEDQEYSDLITTYFANLSGVDQILVRRLLFLGNIGKERYYQDDFDQARQIFLYLEREYIQLPPNFKKIIQGSKIKYENSLLLKNQIIDKNIIRIFDLGLVYLFVGMTCYQQKSFDKSMDYLNLCQIEYFNNKQREYATAYTIKGIIEFNLGNVDYSTEFFKLSLKYLLKYGTNSDIISNYFNLANILLLERKFQKAENYYKLVLETANKINEKDFMVLSLNKLSEIAINNGDYHRSINLLQKSLKYLSNPKDNYLVMVILFKLYFNYHKAGFFLDANKLINKLKKRDDKSDITIRSIYLICAIHNLMLTSTDELFPNQIIEELYLNLQNKTVPDIIKYFGYITYILTFNNLPLDLRKINDLINQINNKWLRTDLLGIIETYVNLKDSIISIEKLNIFKSELQNKLMSNIILIYEL